MREHRHPELQAAKYVVFVNSGRRYTDCSDDVCTLVGYARSEILTMTIADLSFDKISVSPLFEKYQREARQNGEFILRHKNGTPILIHYNAWVFDDGCHAAAWEPAEDWEQLYLAALLETHPSTLREKVNAALSAIQKHQQSGGVVETPNIRQKLADAREALRTLLS
jgi:PAS domain-containing protein